MDKKTTKQMGSLKGKEIAETLGYTQEIQLKHVKDNSELKSMLFKLLILLIITGAAAALIFGIGIAKAVI